MPRSISRSKRTKPIFARWSPALVTYMLLLCACSPVSQIYFSGNKQIAIESKPYTGVSSLCNTESQARKTAFEDALAQISMFNGLEVSAELSYSASSQSAGQTETRTEEVQQRVSVLSKCFFEATQVEYYSQAQKTGEGIQYKSWCYIPFDEQKQETFLNKLIQGHKAEIERSEQRQAEPLTDLKTYLENLQRTTQYYFELQTVYKAKFSTPNRFTAFLQNKVDEQRNRINTFYASLFCVISSDAPNTMNARFTYNDKPFLPSCQAKEQGTTVLIDTLSISTKGNDLIITAKPLHSGTTTLRIYPEFEKFAPFAELRFWDQSLKLQLMNRFVGKKIGIAIYDKQSSSFLNSAAASLGKLIASLEATSQNLNPEYTSRETISEEKLIYLARASKCDYLITGQAEITNQRFNPNQGVYIAFPALSLGIIDLTTEALLWQNNYPNAELDDIRGLGKNEQQAVQAALSFEPVFSSKVLKETLSRMRE